MTDHIRRAELRETDALTALCLRSKAHWGYDAAFMAAAAPVLTLTPDLLERSSTYVLERDGGIVGFYVLAMEEGSPTLRDLWVEPGAIRGGAGRALFAHMRGEARRLGYATVTIESDPNAEGFYRRMGARRVGTNESTIVPGRLLPRMEIDV